MKLFIQRVQDTESRLPLWVATSLTIIFVATLLRLALNFRHALPPAVDGAYYPLQTRWLIEYGELAYKAPPLIFWINASLTKLLQATTGMHLDAACSLASRLVDCLIPPWVALPIMMLGYRWSIGRPERLIGCASAAVLATISPPVMRMASDFQKNSVGLVWMAFAVWALCEALAHKRSVFRWACVALFLLLSAITHIGAFGLTCVTLGTAFAAYCLMESSWLSRKFVPLLAATVASIATLYLITYSIAPEWTGRLMDLPTRAVGLLDFRVPLVSLCLSIVVYGMLGILLRKVILSRREIDSSDLSIVIGCVAGIAVLVIPFLQGTWAMRFLLMTPVPGAILVAFTTARLSIKKWQLKGLTAVTALLALVAPFFMQGPVITVAAAEELKLMREQIEKPSETLVVAPHGVEFWAGMILNTPATRQIPDESTSYHRVLLMMPKEEFGRPRPPEMREHSERHYPPRGRPHPPHPQRMPQDLTIPADAPLVHEGTYFRFFEIE